MLTGSAESQAADGGPGSGGRAAGGGSGQRRLSGGHCCRAAEAGRERWGWAGSGALCAAREITSRGRGARVVRENARKRSK